MFSTDSRARFAQAEALQKVLAQARRKIDKVILINTPDAVVHGAPEAAAQLPGSALRRGLQYPDASRRKIEASAISAARTLIIREDDRPETIRERQKQYWHETAPLIDYYHRKGLLARSRRRIAGRSCGRDPEVAVSKIQAPNESAAAQGAALEGAE